ncbi:putative elongation factor ts (ef-ts) [Dioszegia hungarica]|uniref:Elongation factor ts (Ef-ts) n=1 Tax=Dioszegia hungarica TaxID=4972 RepID=A0AA38LS08_9TREE|nr:putative elongation factor ts (ef-ts) [Dioszegia hungarica]KAI9635202.1 putative elongation factor ts (ef-ts) [Dioszegia hungarica]
MARPALRPLALFRQHQRQISTSVPLLAATPSPVQVPVSLIASLRKLRPVPLSLAREALQKSNNNIDSALSYLDSSSSASTTKKAEKVSGRSTSEGVIAISLLGGKRVGMVHVGCETDFVARNDIFLKTSRSIAGTTAFLDVPGEREPSPASTDAPPSTADPIRDFPVSALMEAPIISLPSSDGAPAANTNPTPTTDPTTISQSLLSTLSQTGENLRLLRAVSFAAPFPSSPLIRYVPGAYAHGGSSSSEGKVGGIAVISAQSRDSEKPMAARIHGVGGDQLEKDLLDLARTVARQVVGFPTMRISAGEGGEGEEEALLSQQAMMFGKQEPVAQVLEEWGAGKGLKVDVVGFRRWAVGDDLTEVAAGDPQAQAV